MGPLNSMPTSVTDEEQGYPLHTMDENGVVEEEDDDELALLPGLPILPRSTYFKLILCAALSLLILLACIGIIASTTALAIHESYETQIAGNPGNGDVLTTSEYQITFPKPESQRDSLVDDWMAFWSSHSVYYRTATNTTMATSIRYQYNVNVRGPSTCHSDDYIRVRVFDKMDSAGVHTSGTTVDIKGNSHSASGAFSMPFWPNETLTSQQKMEQDLHECSQKYSRETRVYLTETPTFTHCKDVSVLYPWALKEKYDHNKVSTYDATYWWVREYAGYLNENTKFLIAFTLRYQSLEQAQYETAGAQAGEWSIRLFSLDHGHSYHYNEDVVQDTHDAWKAMMKHFGNGECRD